MRAALTRELDGIVGHEVAVDYRRERHQADYVILVVVVALTAIGILMVYSSSALKGYLSQDADTFATVGPQIQWAILGLVATQL